MHRFRFIRKEAEKKEAVTKKINGNFPEYLMKSRSEEIAFEIANFGIMQFSREHLNTTSNFSL